MSKKQKTKQGVASIYVVVFTIMLIGIITISFLRIMLSESGRTLNDTLSDSAYNAALAGVEDAKYVISQYEIKKAGNISDEYTKLIEETKSSDCDIVEKAVASINNVAYDTSHVETDIGTNSNFQDQAYTCVTLKLNGNFVGELSANNPTLVIPLKPVSDTSVNEITGVHLKWNMISDTGDDLSTFSGEGLQELKNGSFSLNTVDNTAAIDENGQGRVLGRRGVKKNTATALNGLRLMLVQSPASGSVDYYASEPGTPGRTNRGSLMLLASKDGIEGTIGATELVNSANKTLNAPLAVKCNEAEGNCSINVEFPKPKGDTTDRNPDNFFLVLNQLYSEPSIKVTVEMLKGGTIVDFFNVQPIIDSTGRSGDLFRRVEARVGTDNGASLVPTAELSTNGEVDKSFYVTKNCIKDTDDCD